MKVLSKLDRFKIHLVLAEDYFSVKQEGWEPIVSPVRSQPRSDPNRKMEIEERFSSTGLDVIAVPIHLLPPRFYGVGVLTHLALPFCCYLGFKRIVFVGMDLGGWNHFYAVKRLNRIRRSRSADKTKQKCWDGKERPNVEAVRNLDLAIFSRSIPEYNRLIPDDVKFYHTTPRPKPMRGLDILKTKLGLSEQGKTGFWDPEGFFIHELEEHVPYIEFGEAIQMANGHN